ncbi:MAG: PBP1A family penicillin-binding protein [Rhizobiaceae bacterium]
MLDDEQVKPNKKNTPSRLLEADAWLDTFLYALRTRLSAFWEAATIGSRRLHVTGLKRGIVEVLDEGFTIGVAGLVVLLSLAIPAFQETSKDWRKGLELSVTFLDRFGNEIGKRGILHKDGVPLDVMPDHVIKAVLATEDRRFFDHLGIDFFGLSRALFENVRANTVVQGGSTITQQLAKNLFLTNERTLQRKIKEAFLSIWLEANMSKKEIFQLYLDRAYMGGGTFGIVAASEFYFNKKVENVSLAEAAMLAGLFKAPTKYAPHINLPAARARANEVLSNMVQAGFLTEGQVVDARRHPASIVDRGDSTSPDFFLDWAFEEVRKVAENTRQKSFVVRSTIDMDLQAAAEESAEFHLRQFGEEYGVTQAAIVMLDVDGSVRALVGGRDYGASQFNRATKALRQAGSSFKSYIYAAAMENGYTPESVVSDGPISWGNWSPKNYSRSFSGRVNLTSALARSLNTVAVRLAKELGTTKIAALAKAMGVESEISLHKTMSLGTSGMTVLDQATGYLSFATGGYSGKRHGVTQVLSNTGELVWDFNRDAKKPVRVLSEEAVASMNTMLAAVTEAGTGRRALLPGIRVGGKTGTTQSYRDAWFVGFTGNYLAAVWFGNDDFTSTKELTGGLLPAMTWQRLMAYAHQNVDIKPIPGLANPFVEKPKDVDPKSTKPAKDQISAGEARIRPAVLNQNTRNVLVRLLQQFRTAPPLEQASDKQNVSAIAN